MLVASANRQFQIKWRPSATVTAILKDHAASMSPSSAKSSGEVIIEDSSRALAPPYSIAFVYGTLKRGFGNSWLIQEQIAAKHARLMGTADTKHAYPLVCGPFQVPFLVNTPGTGYHVKGEVYQLDKHALELVDELEGTSKGHYMRCPIVLTNLQLEPSFSSQQSRDGENKSIEIHAEAYFAASHYSSGLCLAPCIEAYTEEEAASYTRRHERPQNRTFLEHVYEWIEHQKLATLQRN